MFKPMGKTFSILQTLGRTFGKCLSRWIASHTSSTRYFVNQFTKWETQSWSFAVPVQSASGHLSWRNQTEVQWFIWVRLSQVGNTNVYYRIYLSKTFYNEMSYRVYHFYYPTQIVLPRLEQTYYREFDMS